ncbi:MAG: hypothetical protein SPI53_05430 [Erysipelotrichaceae bacterium]|nr:hypothetical protein [Erysipelotrichaceae bacterium]
MNFFEINNIWETRGVIFVDKSRTYISDDAIIGEGTVLYPDVYLEGKCVIGKNCQILPGSFLVNATIGNDTKIISSRITDSSVGDHCSVGPNSHLRLNTKVMNECRIGNFVEFKNTEFGNQSRCAHLTYLGDSVVGEDVNIGCGVVTVNYDGVNKHKTIIQDHAFVGSNSNLIAPLTIGKYGLVAAGSTINKDIEDGDMAIARSRQEYKKAFGYKYIKKER